MNYKIKNELKIIIDIVLLALTITLFNKSLISMKYHEVTGLVVIGIMLIHIGINIKTAKAMCVKFTRLPAALKVCIIIDVLLLINFLCFGISGVLCSKTILTSISSSNNIFKLYHMASGASALVLLGIHIGLHICRRSIPKKAAVILTVIFVAAGAYSVSSSSFIRRASIPFNTISSSQAVQNEKQNGGAVEERSNEKPNMAERNEHDNQNAAGYEKRGAESTIADKALSIAMYFSMIAAFSMVTYIIAVPKRRKAQCDNISTTA